MTRLFDQQARQTYASHGLPFPEFGRPNPQAFFVDPQPEAKPRELTARQITAAQARPYIATHHYSRTMPDATTEVFAGFYGPYIAGIMVFGMGASKSIFTRLDPDIQDGEYRELTRGWVADDAPQNTNTRLIAEAIRALPEKVKFVVSFADSAQGHEGTVYRAANFDYDGTAEGAGAVLHDENGHEVHPRLLGIYKQRHPEKYGDLTGPEIAKALGWTLTSGGRSLKHRFVYYRHGRKKWGARRKQIEPATTEPVDAEASNE